MSTVKKAATPLKFTEGQAVVYPGRGVGRINAIEQQEVAGFKLEVFAVAFDREKAVIKIPTTRAAQQGLRPVSDAKTIDAVLEVLSGRARKSKAMWSRKATEFEAKINSGDILQLAEVARDLHRAEGESEASFSERGLYENATGLIAYEVSAARNITETEAHVLIQASLAKSPRRGSKDTDDGEDVEQKVA